MRLAVVGSRDLDPAKYWIVRYEIQKVALRVGWDNFGLVSGGARGVDAMAERAAQEFSVPIEVHKADWKRYGRRAGILRNADIVAAADELLAFFGRERTPGTSDSIRRAIAKRIPVAIFEDGSPVPTPPTEQP